MRAWRAVEEVVTSSPPNSGTTPAGAFTGWTTLPSSICPYVAKASVVAGVQTGSSTSAASAAVPDAAPTWIRAEPARTAAIGKRTSARSFAATTRRRPAPAVSAALRARTATSTVISASVWFCTTTGSSKRSPKFRKRGADGRTMSGRRATSVASPEPKRRAPSTATAITR